MGGGSFSERERVVSKRLILVEQRGGVCVSVCVCKEKTQCLRPRGKQIRSIYVERKKIAVHFRSSDTR